MEDSSREPTLSWQALGSAGDASRLVGRTHCSSMPQRLVHFLSKYCAEWLTFITPARRSWAVRRHNLWDKPPFRSKLDAMGSPARAKKKSREFDPNTFLATIGEGRKNLTFAKKQGIFAQGDAADPGFYIQKGKVKLTVVSKTGREATIGMLTDGDFFGEGALAGQTL